MGAMDESKLVQDGKTASYDHRIVMCTSQNSGGTFGSL